MEEGNAHRRVGVITGLQSEARCLNVHPLTTRAAVRCAGASADRAAYAAHDLIKAQCEALVSFGVAGGLDDTVKPGDIVLADRVMGSGGSEISTCDQWRARVLDAIGDDIALSTGPVFSAGEAIASASEKTATAQSTGAVAVDMESYPIAKTARLHRVPVLVVRAIADPSNRSMPQWITTTIDEHGDPKIASVIAGLMRHPSDILSLLLLAGDSARGHSALRRFVLRIGPLFGFVG